MEPYKTQFKSRADMKPYKTQFKSRAGRALEQFHYFAKMMHPKHMGKRNDAQEKLAEDWIQTVNPNYLPLVMAFQIQDEKI